MRFHIVNRGRDGKERPLLAEDQMLVGFRGSPGQAQWLEADEIEPLTLAAPQTNIAPEIAEHHIAHIVDELHHLQPHLDRVVDERGRVLLQAHRRVRKASQAGVRSLSFDAHKPARCPGRLRLPPNAGYDMRRAGSFACVTTEGGLLPQDLLERIPQRGSRPPGDKRGILPPRRERPQRRGREPVVEPTERQLARLPIRAGQGAGGICGDDGYARALAAPLFDTLGYGRLARASTVEIEGRRFAISHKSVYPVPVHLLGAGVSLDTRRSGVAGAARMSPHGLMQDFLNRSEDHLWGFLSNGLRLRVMRDHHS